MDEQSRVHLRLSLNFHPPPNLTTEAVCSKKTLVLKTLTAILPSPPPICWPFWRPSERLQPLIVVSPTFRLMSWTLRFHVLLSVVMTMASLKGSAQLVVCEAGAGGGDWIEVRTTVLTR